MIARKPSLGIGSLFFLIRARSRHRVIYSEKPIEPYGRLIVQS